MLFKVKRVQAVCVSLFWGIAVRYARWPPRILICCLTSTDIIFLVPWVWLSGRLQIRLEGPLVAIERIYCWNDSTTALRGKPSKGNQVLRTSLIMESLSGNRKSSRYSVKRHKRIKAEWESRIYDLHTSPKPNHRQNVSRKLNPLL